MRNSHEEACNRIYDLVIKLNTNLMRSTYKGDDDIISLIDILSKEIDSLTLEASMAREVILFYILLIIIFNGYYIKREDLLFIFIYIIIIF